MKEEGHWRQSVHPAQHWSQEKPDTFSGVILILVEIAYGGVGLGGVLLGTLTVHSGLSRCNIGVHEHVPELLFAHAQLL